MILVDTSVWIHFLRRGDAHLAGLLDANAVLMHPFVLGELACGNLGQRNSTLELLQNLPAASAAEIDEIPGFIERNRLYGRGIGYVDVHLLAAVALTGGTTLWTRDAKLRTVAEHLGFAYPAQSAH